MTIYVYKKKKKKKETGRREKETAFTSAYHANIS